MNLNKPTVSRNQAPEPRNRDAVLLGKARAGDRQALGEIYDTTYQEVWRTVRSILRNEDDSLDALQDTYLKAFAKLDQLKNAASLRPWLRQIAANTARDVLCRKKPALFSELAKEDGDEPDFDLPDDRIESTPEMQLDRKETQRLVSRMLDDLSDEQRLVMNLYYYQELPVKTISEQLDVPQNTVKSQLRYAREKIEKQVRRLERQGVKLYGLAPLAFFRLLYGRSVDSMAEPPALGKLTKQIMAEGTKALHAGPASGSGLKAVTAKAMAARRIAAAAAAVAVVGGVAAGTMLLKNRGHRFGKIHPSEPSETEPSFVDQYADNGWKEGFLGLLAGTETLGQEADWANGILSPLGRPGFVTENDSNWYLCDLDHDGAPELLSTYFSTRAADRGFTVFSWRDNQILTEYHSYMDWMDYDRIVPFDAPTEDGCALLYCDENAEIFYTSGTREVGVTFDLGERPMIYSVVFTDGSGSDYFELPTYGILREPEHESYEMQYETYLLSQEDADGRVNYEMLIHYTVTESGDEYFLRDKDYLTEAEYRAEEERLLGMATWRSIDHTELPQLKSIPGTAEVYGPYTTTELVEFLGGFDDRPEWSAARRWLAHPTSYAKRYSAIMQDQRAMLDTLREQYPEESFGAGEWQFAAWCSETEEPGHELWVLYRQTPEEGGSCFLAADTEDSEQPYFSLRFDRFVFAENAEFYYDGNVYSCDHDRNLRDLGSVSILRRVKTEAGASSVLFNFNEDVVFDAEKPLRRINFVSAEELTAKLAEDPEVIEQGLDAPASVKELLQPDPSAAPLAWMTLYLEHPAMIVFLDQSSVDRHWEKLPEPINDASLSQWEWDAAMLDRPDGQSLVIRGWNPSAEDGNWAFLEVSETGTLDCYRPSGEIGSRVVYTNDTSEDLEKYPVDRPAEPEIPIPGHEAPMYVYSMEMPAEDPKPTGEPYVVPGYSDGVCYGWQADVEGTTEYIAFHFGLLDPEAIRATEPLTFYSIPGMERFLLTGSRSGT